MKIDIFGKEREITLKGSLIFIGELIAFFCVAKILQYHVAHVNDDEIVKMQAAIPAVMSMEGTETLPEKMKMISRDRGIFFGRCQIDEKASGKEIIKHYKSEFQKYGWKYIGRYYWNDIHPNANSDDWYYYFEKEGAYCMYLCYSNNDFKYYGKTRIVFYIDLKKDYDDRKYCQIEDEEP